MNGPVALLLTQYGQEPVFAQTIFTFSELAHHPTSLWLTMPQTSQLISCLQPGSRFSLAVLSADQKTIARQHVGNGDIPRIKLEPYEGFWIPHGVYACAFCQVRETVLFEQDTLLLSNILGGVFESQKTHLRHLLISDL